MADYFHYFESGKFNFIPNVKEERICIIRGLAKSGELIPTATEQISYVIRLLKEEMLPVEWIFRKDKGDLFPFTCLNFKDKYIIRPRDYYGHAFDKNTTKTKVIQGRGTRVICYCPDRIVSFCSKIAKSWALTTEQLRFYTFFIIGFARAKSNQLIVRDQVLASPEAQRRYKEYGADRAGDQMSSMGDRYATWQGFGFAKRRLAGVESTF